MYLIIDFYFIFRYDWPKPTEEEYDSGRYSPVLLKPEKLEPGALVIDASEDAERIAFLQKRLMRSETAVYSPYCTLLSLDYFLHIVLHYP